MQQHRAISGVVSRQLAQFDWMGPTVTFRYSRNRGDCHLSSLNLDYFEAPLIKQSSMVLKQRHSKLVSQIRAFSQPVPASSQEILHSTKDYHLSTVSDYVLPPQLKALISLLWFASLGLNLMKNALSCRCQSQCPFLLLAALKRRFSALVRLSTAKVTKMAAILTIVKLSLRLVKQCHRN